MGYISSLPKINEICSKYLLEKVKGIVAHNWGYPDNNLTADQIIYLNKIMAIPRLLKSFRCSLRFS